MQTREMVFTSKHSRSYVNRADAVETVGRMFPRARFVVTTCPNTGRFIPVLVGAEWALAAHERFPVVGG